MLNFKNIFLCVQSRLPAGNKPFYILLFVFTSVFCSAQINFVSNPSFELYDTCPVSYSTPSDFQLETALNWKIPTMGTSDYFNQCATSASFVDVPLNAFGFQNAYDGGAYAGFFVYEENFNYREYLQTKFVQPMVAGNSYDISFYVCLSDYSEFASSQIGAYISNYPISSTNPFGNPLNVVPQIENPMGNFITDTSNWTLIKGTYVSTGNEQYITIGNFHDSINNDTIEVPFNISVGKVSYYYIDGISVSPLFQELILPNIITPNNDGVNDYFSFEGHGLEEVNCIIYNRWGNIIYTIKEVNSEWNGLNQNGQNCNDGIYYYVLDAKGEDKKEYKQKGFIQLLR
ncbi:MAG: gliding motility-associated C-terminal domain-containing protein [Bacteroidetes bacterium]|nr:gliding motility-associated C-terminal domain-containing protein [Bacteroidota bacterium]